MRNIILAVATVALVFAMSTAQVQAGGSVDRSRGADYVYGGTWISSAAMQRGLADPSHETSFPDSKRGGRQDQRKHSSEHPIPVPEPATIMLLGAAGLIAFVSVRRWLKS